MLNDITSNIYRRLREKARLTKNALAPLLGVSRHKVTKFENGTSQPTAAQMEKLMELAGCTWEEVALMAIKKLGVSVGKPAGFLPRDAEGEPMTPLVSAKILVKRYAHRLSASLLQALTHKIKTMRFMGMAVEGHNKEMRVLVELAMDKIKHDREFDDDVTP